MRLIPPPTTLAKKSTSLPLSLVCESYSISLSSPSGKQLQKVFGSRKRRKFSIPFPLICIFRAILTMPKTKSFVVAYFYSAVLLMSPFSADAFFWDWIIASPHEVEQLSSGPPTPGQDAPGGEEPIQRDSPLNKIADSTRQSQRTPRPGRARGGADGRFNDHHTELCSNDKECPVGKFCDSHYGICKEFRKEGLQCRRDYHCQPGLDCMFGRCLPAVKPGLAGSRCEMDSDCLPGHCCAKQHGERVCKPRLRLGQRCYIPDGGLAYSLNELCPCDEALLCGTVRRNRLEETLEVDSTIAWSNRHRLRCIRP